MFGFVWLILLSWKLIQTSANQRDEAIITVDHLGFDTLECCAYGRCSCSSLALALERAVNNTEIRMMSSISLHHDVEFVNVSSIIITGYNNPTIMCDHQGGLVGNYIKQITIQNITWDKCNGIVISNFKHTNIFNCIFQYCTNVTLTSQLGSLNIYTNTFSHNSGSVYVEAVSINIANSYFYDNKANALIILGKPDQLIEASIIGCNFSKNSGYSVKFAGGIGRNNLFQKGLKITSCNFNGNSNTGLHVEFCNATYVKDSTFYNNFVAISGGAAIRAINSMINITGVNLFKNNVAVDNGGAVYLENSHMSCQGSVLFHHNTAKYGGAVYISINSDITMNTNQTSLTLTDNVAVSYGGAVYINVDPSGSDDYTYLIDHIQHHYDLLLKSLCSKNNTANMIPNCAYFNISSASCNDISLPSVHNNLLMSPLCRMDFSNVTLENANYSYDNQFTLVYEFPLHKLHFDVVISDYFGNLVGPVNVSANCGEENDITYNYFVDSFNHNITLTNDSIYHCYIDITIDQNLFLNFYAFDNGFWTSVEVPIPWVVDPCNTNIAYIETYEVGCVPLNCTYLTNTHYDMNIMEYVDSTLGIQCNKYSGYADGYYLTTQPGYWYSNGYQKYAVVCPTGHCWPSYWFVISDAYPFTEPYPDSNIQCSSNWKGLVCGECNSTSYAIQYDAINCIYIHHCFGKTDSVRSNLLLLLSASFVYWCLVISFIFVLLHFQFNVTAGYVYGVIFYYSVIEVFINTLIKNHNLDPDSIASLVLPFLTNVGYLRVPFIKYLRLCLHRSHTIDHVFLGYIHPLIVTCLVVIIFITSRRFVVVARYIGRYINSKSICLLLLLSYSSVCYTSMQLLKPLAVFDTAMLGGMKWHTYLSPTIQYFHGRHILYGIIAILCELIIGIGLPLVILTQRYLIRYFNLKLISIKPVIDQLQGCYKEEYRWFAAYYLICRQVIYATDIICDLLSIRSIENDGSQLSSAAITPMFCACILMLVIHVWLQPYKRKGLNILDGCILLALVFVMVTGTSPDQDDDDITALLLILPLLLLVNYLALNSKLKHIFIPGSCIAIISIELLINPEFLWWSTSVIHIFTVLIPLVCLIVYIILVVKYCYTRHHNKGYLPINRQNDIDDLDEDTDSS